MTELDLLTITVNSSAMGNGMTAKMQGQATHSTKLIKSFAHNLTMRPFEMSNPDSVESIDARLGELQRELISRADRREDYDDIANEIFQLREQREKSMLDDTARSEYLNRMKELQDFISAQPSSITEFDETLVKHLLARITVHDDYLEFRFKSGVTVEIKN